MYLLKNDEAHKPRLSDLDCAFVQASIRLGMSRVGGTAPNPSVGALIVRYDADGLATVVGRGVTADGGRPHGEVVALREAGEAARGATCYVSLEPCAHHGRTPPCVDALVRAGIARVVIAMRDPDPRVSGKGAAFLRQAGIHVIDDAAVLPARLANLGHVTKVSKKRPALTLKLALSRDGMIGREGEGFVPVTGELSRRAAHAMRARADVVMTGIGTVLADDPDLTCRLPGMAGWSPMRVILDTDARTPVTARIFEKIRAVPVRIYAGEGADPRKIALLKAAGAEVFLVAREDGGICLRAAMHDLAARGATNVMVEGGARLAGRILKEGLADRAAIFEGAYEIGAKGIPALSSGAAVDDLLRVNGLFKSERAFYGEDALTIWERG